MDKRRLALHVTLLPLSQTAEYYVEHDSGNGRWELWSEGTWTLSNGPLGAFSEFADLLGEMTAEPSPSLSHTSDVG